MRATGTNRRSCASAVVVTTVALVAACTGANPAYRGEDPTDGPRLDMASEHQAGIDTAGAVDGARPPDLAAPAPVADPSRYGFEKDTQGWGDLRQDNTAVRRSTGRTQRGVGSLEIALQTASGSQSDFRYVGVAGFGAANPGPPAGATITFHLWVPPSGISGVQPFVLYVPPGAGAANSVWAGNFMFTSALARGQWNALTVVVPRDSMRVVEVGVEWRTEGAWTGTVNVDAVDW